jgi:hypothetical protein
LKKIMKKIFFNNIGLTCNFAEDLLRLPETFCQYPAFWSFDPAQDGELVEPAFDGRVQARRRRRTPDYKQRPQHCEQKMPRAAPKSAIHVSMRIICHRWAFSQLWP